MHATEFSVSAVRGGYLDGSPTNTTPLILFWQSYGNVEDRDHDISSGRSGNDDQDDPMRTVAVRSCEVSVKAWLCVEVPRPHGL